MRTRSKAKMELARDRISTLPSQAMEGILACLPIRDAVRSSVLSSKWNHKWTAIPSLVFDDTCVQPSPSDTIQDCRSKFARFVTRVFSLHTGPIHKLKLAGKYLESCQATKTWIENFVSPRDIKEFTLMFQDTEPLFDVPDCVFSYPYLFELKLVGCAMNPPFRSEPYTNLVRLILDKCVIPLCKLDDILYECPHLNFLVLKFYGSLKLFILGRSLENLFIEGEFEHLRIVDAPLLRILHVNLYNIENVSDHLEETTTCNMLDVIRHAPLLEVFIAKRYSMKYLSKNVPNRLNQTYYSMWKLELHNVDFEEVDQISAVFCLMDSSPNLEELICSSYTFKKTPAEADLGYWGTKHKLRRFFRRLRFVQVDEIYGSPNEMQFIKFLLAKSPVLERMSMEVLTMYIGWDKLAELLAFPRASEQARVSVINVDHLVEPAYLESRLLRLESSVASEDSEGSSEDTEGSSVA